MVQAPCVCGSAPHWAHCKHTLRCCCPARGWRVVARRVVTGDSAGIADAAGDCAVGPSISCRLRSLRVMESSTASPASLMRVRRECGSSVVSLSLSSGSGSRASPRRTLAYPPGCGDLQIHSSVWRFVETTHLCTRTLWLQGPVPRHSRYSNAARLWRTSLHNNNGDMERMTPTLLRV